MAGPIQFGNGDTFGNNTTVTAANPLPIAQAGTTAANPNGNPTAVSHGQQAVTATATALPTATLVNGVVLTAPAANSAPVFVGGTGVTTANGYPLPAGGSVSIATANLNNLRVVGTVGTTISWLGN